MLSTFLTILSFPLLLSSPSSVDAHSQQVAMTAFPPPTTLSSPRQSSPLSDSELLRQTIYTPSDSAEVVRLLGADTGPNDVLYYARHFKGIPYVGATLEKADPEQLVVNLRQLDCTTLVETVWALALTRRQHSRRFEDYCRNLMRLRYWNGEMNGYLSRLHYFTWWMHDNLSKGIMIEVTDPKLFTAPMRVHNYYMSAHPSKYRFLKNNLHRVRRIAQLEKQYNGPDGTYLPAAATALPASRLSCVRNGDMIAIVTRKAGLDYSHLGFAVWGRDGKLHLLNASSIHHKVVEEPKTLRQYLKEHPTSVGIRVFRLNYRP